MMISGQLDLSRLPTVAFCVAQQIITIDAHSLATNDNNTHTHKCVLSQQRYFFKAKGIIMQRLR